MRCYFSTEPLLSEKLFGLLDTVFPGVRSGAERIRSLGVPWESVSTPFIHFADGAPVSHVGIIEMPLVVRGEQVTAASIHGVATHPDFRRRGLYRSVMEEALEYCRASYGTQILTTGHPEYFLPFGFRVVQEYCFHARITARGRPDGMRLLDLADGGDIRMLHRILDSREPVSHVLGVIKEKAVFCFNEARRDLYYVPDADAIVCIEFRGARVDLYDVAAPRMPALERILAALPSPAGEIYVHFSPDRLGSSLDPAPRIFDHDGPSYLMARGAFAAEGAAFTLPRSART